NVWLNPKNSKNLVIADDGGASITFNAGKTWSGLDNMPTAQFYRINADNMFPYNIYGGQQDNSSVKIASRAIEGGGINERNWWPSAGGESAFLAFDPDNPRYVMGGSYLGTIELLDMVSNQKTSIMAAPIQYLGKAARDMKYLYNWNAPVIWSKHEPGTFYHAAQLVLKTKDNGMTWDEVSPDLTRNIDEKQGNGGGPLTNEAVGAENYGTLSYLVESPHEKGVLWSGSDDGLVHITKDNAVSWQNVTPKGLEECLVNAIEVSPHDPATAYIATTRYKFNDKTPSIYKTTNYGKTWEKITNGIPNDAFTRVVREDKDKKDLLYAGTETGLYISWNGGKAWESLQLNLPVTPINDLMVHQGDLIVATSGRSFWILDDLKALGNYSKKGVLKLYEPEPSIYGSWRSPLNGNSDSFKGTDPFEGINPASGVVIYYELPAVTDSAEVKMEIRNSAGQLIRSFTNKAAKGFKSYPGGPPAPAKISAQKGLNRFVWDKLNETMPGIPMAYLEANFRGHMVSPGDYTIKVVFEGKEVETKAKIVANPLVKFTAANHAAFDQFMTAVEAELTAMHDMINKLYNIKNQLSSVLSTVTDKALKAEGEAIVTALDTWDKSMVQRMSKAYDDVENFPNMFTAEYIFMINHSDSSIPLVAQSNRDRKAELDVIWAAKKAQAEAWMKGTLPDFNKKLWEAGIGALNKH
ncbi:MAG: hypothetical protein ACJASP_001903, partial [Roseivirga sp.]